LFLREVFKHRNHIISYPNGSQGAMKPYINSTAHLMKGHSLRKKRILIKGCVKKEEMPTLVPSPIQIF
jgi:hypothetical protein